ncbi:MAG TPA: hypothetical protein PK006_01190 [Saprospiraceae bacterium]|nr:hypothetical protein [Saprospiraceae bacterium]
MKERFIRFGILFFSLFSNHLVAQLDQCKGVPIYMTKMGFNPEQSYISTSERNVMGLVIMQSDQPGNPRAKIIKSAQAPSWKKWGYLGAITTDEHGNSYILPAAKVNMLYNKVEYQNTIYKLDAMSGELQQFISLPMEIKPGAKNPFGLLGSFYDCSNHLLIVSTVAGSDEKKERGKVYIVDPIKKTYKVIFENKDFYGLAVHVHEGKKFLFLSSARSGDLYSVEVDQMNQPIGNLKKEFSINGIGLRGDDRIRKIRFTGTGQMILNTVLFYYNLTAPSEEQVGRFTYQWNKEKKTWELLKVE